MEFVSVFKLIILSRDKLTNDKFPAPSVFKIWFDVPSDDGYTKLFNVNVPSAVKPLVTFNPPVVVILFVVVTFPDPFGDNTMSPFTPVVILISPVIAFPVFKTKS